MATLQVYKTIDGRDIQIVVPEPLTGAAGQALNDNFKNIADCLEELKYIAPEILSFSGGGTAEVGAVVSSVLLTWTRNKDVNDQTIDQGVGSVGPTATSHLFTDPTTSDRTWTLTIDDGQNTDQAQTSLLFKHKVYWGVNASPTLTSADILALANNEFRDDFLKNFRIDGQGAYVWVAFPQSFGLPRFRVNDVTHSAWAQQALNFTNSEGHVEPYYAYRTDTVHFGTLDVEVLDG